MNNTVSTESGGDPTHLLTDDEIILQQAHQELHRHHQDDHGSNNDNPSNHAFEPDQEGGMRLSSQHSFLSPPPPLVVGTTVTTFLSSEQQQHYPPMVQQHHQLHHVQQQHEEQLLDFSHARANSFPAANGSHLLYSSPAPISPGAPATTLALDYHNYQSHQDVSQDNETAAAPAELTHGAERRDDSILTEPTAVQAIAPTILGAETHPPDGVVGERGEDKDDPVFATSTPADNATPLIHEEDPHSKRSSLVSNHNNSNTKANTERWTAMYQRLQTYQQQYGHCLVPKRYPDDPQLGTFVETQRVQYKRLKRTIDELTGNEMVIPNNRMTTERLSLLEAIGFAWSAKTPTKRKDGPTEPFAGGDDPTPKPKRRRASPEDMPPPSATDSVVDTEGNGVEPVPTQTVRTDSQQQALQDKKQWEDLYQRLVAFKNQHGHCLVPRKFNDDPKLARWVEIQRGLWNRDYRSNGHGGVGASASLVSSNDGTTVTPAPPPAAASSTTLETGPMESVVASTPCTMDANATLPAELDRSGHDNQTPVDWDASYFPTEDVDADETLAMVGTDPSALEHDAAVVATAAETATWPTSTLDGTEDLDGMAERDDHANKLPPDALPTKQLTQDRKDKLDAIGFVWDLRSKRIEDHWDEMFQQLCDYKQQHGDCRVPSRYEPNPRLGKWVETQRYEYTKLHRATHGGLGSAGTTDFRADAPTHLADSTVFPAAKPRGVSPRLTEERVQRLEGIGFEWKIKNKMKRYYDKQWDQMFERLLQYKQVQGHCLVPKRFPADPRLGTWCHTQRIQFKKSHLSDSGNKPMSSDGLSDPESEELPDKGYDEASQRLTEERRKRLEEIGFCWSAREKGKAGEPAKVARNSYDDRWDEMFNRLVAYKERYGHCLVPKRYKEDPKLGTWTDTQRSVYKRMKKKLANEGIAYQGSSVQCNGDDALGSTTSTPKTDKPVIGRLTEERIQRLESIGFVWSLRDDWQQHYEELKQFKMQHGHVNVPARYEKNKKLGLWVSAQRQQIKLLQSADGTMSESRRSGSLTKERIDLLTDLGFTWSIRSRSALGENWNHKLNELRHFRSLYGHCNVPARYPDNPELGIWVGTQRTQYRLYMKAKEAGEDASWQSSMTEERIRLLEGLGFTWSIRGDGRRDFDERDSAASLSFDHETTVGRTNDFIAELSQHEPFDALRRETV